MLARMPSERTCNSDKWYSGTSSSARARSVTSAWIPMRNHKSSPVLGCRATVRPRKSRRFRNISPDFFRFGSRPVNAAPVSLAIRRSISMAGSMSQPWLRKRQFTPRISFLMYPVMVSNSSDTAIKGKSEPLGFAIVTQNLHSPTAALSAFFTRTSCTAMETILSMSVAWRLKLPPLAAEVVESLTKSEISDAKDLLETCVWKASSSSKRPNSASVPRSRDACETCLCP
mmetsp:Transcript_70759/g.158416  ORF Transcript_70759/g.158416 Transcript_70759/m.158416 type:complete len:229 (+) Transcript_70759:627-1313(+)